MKTTPILLVALALTACPAPPPPTSAPPPTPTTTAAPAQAEPPTVLSLGGAPARWRVDIVVDNARHRVRLASLGPTLGAIVAEVERQHDLERSDGELRRFNRAPTRRPWPVDRSTLDVVTEYLELGRRTDGAFDVTAGPIRALYGAEGAPTADDLAAARARSGLGRVRVVGGMLQKDVSDLVIDATVMTDAVIARAMVAALAEREVHTRFRVAVGDVLVADGADLAGPWRDLDGGALADTTRVVLARARAGAVVVDPRTAAPVAHDVTGCDVVGRGVDPLAAKALAEACLVAGEPGTRQLRPRFGDVDVRVRRRSDSGG